MNRQVKRQMAKSGADKTRAPDRRPPAPGKAAPKTERTGPRTYLREVSGEFKKVAWPTRPEVIQSTIVVIIGVVVMASLIFGFDWLSLNAVDFIFG